jgi:hypothetical protein
VSGAVEQLPKASRALIARRTLASVASLGVALALLRIFTSEPGDLGNGRWLPALALIAAPVTGGAAIWSRRLALQLLARALWWSLLLFGGLLSLLGPNSTGAIIACGSATALLGAGNTALDTDGRFRPIAFRGTLMLALVLAMADAASFLWFGLAQAIAGEAVRLIWFVPPMIAGVVGLLRLRTWGLLVSLTCNLVFVVLATGGALDLPKELKALFVGTAVAQLLVPVPMWITIVRRRVPSPNGWERPKKIASTIVIAAIAVISVVSALGQLGDHVL